MRAALVLALALFSTAARAAERPVIDPAIERALRVGTVLVGGHPRVAPAPRAVPVSIELRGAADAAAFTRLRSAGVKLHEVEGRVLHYKNFVPAEVDRAALRALANLESVARVSHLGWRGPPPLDHSAQLIGLAGARGARPALDLVTGSGMLVADLDSNVDVFHPTFFRADAGAYDWLDVDGDGVFTPGVDAIDLNRNGVVDAGEVARWLECQTYDGYTSARVNARSASFDPAIDWVYLDTNGNGSRDFGAAAGFTDATPAFGEPLFVPDDVNRSGAIEKGERFFRLGTSKFRKIWVYLQYYVTPTEDHVFVRGTDLSSMKADHTHGTVYGFSDALHATGVLSIVAGDVPLVGRRFVGMAPDAEIVLGWELSVANATATWAFAENPDVTLFEMCPWTGYPMDGADPLSALLDAAPSTVTHTCPVGDQADARKHARATVAAQAKVGLAFDNPASLGATYVEVSLNLRGAGASGVTASLTEPGGQSDDLTVTSGGLSTGATYYVTDSLSSRGTRLIDVILYTYDAANFPLPTGTFSVALTGDGAQPTTVDAFVSDEVSGFGPGVAWAASIATDDSTLGIPSTADSCIAVAAHTGHPHTSQAPWFYNFPPGGQGQVRDYSPWGPRIDGVQKPDIAAPDNPWAAAPHDKMWGTTGPVLPSGAVSPFGGTSGAAPHVTGVAALLAQAGITGAAARDALRAGGIVDADTGVVPNKRYGFGRLDAAGAFGAARDGQPPTLTLDAQPAFLKPGETATLSPVATDPDGAATGLELKWDDGYDGTWDTAYGPVQPRTVTMATAGTQIYKARVRDATGRIAEAIARVTWADSLPGADAGVDGGSSVFPDAQEEGLDASAAPDVGALAVDVGAPLSADGSTLVPDGAIPASDGGALAALDASEMGSADAQAPAGDSGRAGDGAVAPVDGGNMTPAGGCGCGVAGAVNGLWAILGALAMPLWRRRRHRIIEQRQERT